MRIILSLLALLLLIGSSCGPASEGSTEANPAAPNFNLAASDAAAIEIADEVMEAMGGRRAWDTTRYIGWNFFGRRTHMWDKIEERVRIDIPADTLSMIIDLSTRGGSAKKGGKLVTNLEELNGILDQGYKAWINDSYWLVMPYKLKDDGVTLKSLGDATTTLGKSADLLELTFNGVGVTPQNKYLIYVDKETDLVTQWDFFPTAADTTARFQSPWPNYKKYGDILLSGGQIASNKLTDIQVSQEVSLGTWEL